MATNMKRTTTTTSAKTTDVTTSDVVKKFKKTDLIECRSITNGKLVVVGKRTGDVYRFMDYGDIVSISYEDLLAAVNDSNPRSFIYKPRLIVDDNDFIDQNAKLKEFYDSMYTKKDFEKILDLPVDKMAKVINELPDGAKECLKGLVSTMINTGKLDSVKKIKTLDGVLNTQLFLTLTDK